MSKDKKEAKASKGEGNHAEIAKKLAALKEEKGAVYKKISGLRMKYKVAKGDEPSDKAARKEWKELHTTHKALKVQCEELEAQEKASRPASERRVKYVYPPECDTKELRKAFRTKERAKAKRGDAPVKEKKVKEAVKESKGSKKVIADVVDAKKKGKKDKKKNKKGKKAVAED